LNNIRALIVLFDGVIYKEDFIMLPGDEIVEKKHKNIKHLMAMDRNTDLSKRATRKFPGLGQCVFKVDFEKEFKAYAQEGEPVEEVKRPSSGKSGRPSSSKRPPSGGKNAKGQAQQEPPKDPDVVENEINTEIEVQNTAHHKSIIKWRNENYTSFKTRFQKSLNLIMERFDGYRKEEVRFQTYWNSNLKEITVKHI